MSLLDRSEKVEYKYSVQTLANRRAQFAKRRSAYWATALLTPPLYCPTDNSLLSLDERIADRTTRPESESHSWGLR